MDRFTAFAVALSNPVVCPYLILLLVDSCWFKCCSSRENSDVFGHLLTFVVKHAVAMQEVGTCYQMQIEEIQQYLC